ncbi:hypothetical protein V496_07033 [Pseudogymnoascus sp. VKM F-4515 (FW-2607)]|nr:hypothetical protein V496_07033 [Pseudogymnoascus sp. VKM F-4515 (FW-2607)]KFY79708.1 hypothetical protein V498_08919 [Pseudogymnoascus sp. VKM F-4517 (FW-2822)]
MWWWGKSIKFDPDQDIGDLAEKVILVTGGNSGLGKETVLRLAKHNPKCIYLGTRSLERGEEALSDIKTEAPDSNIKLLQIDMASFASIESAVAVVTSSLSESKADSERLDVLINNAGVSNLPPDVTKDGYELQFGTNHMGHALLTKLLLPMMLKTAELAPDGGSVRIVNISSDGHYHATAPGIHFDDLNIVNNWTRYAQSKLANILHAKALAKRYPSIISVAVSPGTVRTTIFEKMNSPVMNTLIWLFGWASMVDIPEGCKNQLWAATAPGVETGIYYWPVGVTGGGSKFSKDEALEDKLWEWTEAELAKHGY